VNAAAEIVAFLRDLEASPPANALALESRVGGLWRREERGTRVDHFATGTRFPWLAQLELRTSPTLGRGFLLLTVAQDVAIAPDDVRRAIGVPEGAPEPPPTVNPLPTPGSPPAAFEAWKRRSGRSYAVGSLEVAFSFDDDRLIRLSTRLP
jgi:hypothetical protein